MNFVIGLTGPTGAGKSSAADIARQLKIKVIDCDKIARKAVEKGSKGLSALVAAFGEDILSCDGTLNREALAERAFSSKEKTQLLNDTIFPFITELVKGEIDSPVVILDAPTLFESGIDGICNTTIAVLADLPSRKTRIMERDGIDEAHATLRINAGNQDEFYIQNAKHIIYNNSGISDFQPKMHGLLVNILGGIK